jgi:hypothetical protein
VGEYSLRVFENSVLRGRGKETNKRRRKLLDEMQILLGLTNKKGEVEQGVQQTRWRTKMLTQL